METVFFVFRGSIHQWVELFIELRCKDLQGLMAAIFAPLSEASPVLCPTIFLDGKINPPALTS